MTLYRNNGAAHRRADGTKIKHGQEFEPTEKELKAFGDKFERIGPVTGVTRPEIVPQADPVIEPDTGDADAEQEVSTDGEGLSEPDDQDDDEQEAVETGGEDEQLVEDGEADDGESDDEELAEWSMKMTPQRYLELYPNGPQAELAQQHVNAQG